MFRNGPNKFSHVNKSFNIDIASISAPISTTTAGIGSCSSTASTASSSSTSSTTSSASSDVDNVDRYSYPNKQISQIQVTEDEHKIENGNYNNNNNNNHHHNGLRELIFQSNEIKMIANSIDTSDSSIISINKIKNKIVNYDNLVGDRFVYNNTTHQLVNLNDNQLQLNSSDNNKQGKLTLTFLLFHTVVL